VVRLLVRVGVVEVVRPLDLAVGPGEVVAPLGTNGAGKSTALRAIAGFVGARTGRVLVDGEELTG
jgi:ABC-type branched-subunit amino acid transport system ATPase component